VKNEDVSDVVVDVIEQVVKNEDVSEIVVDVVEVIEQVVKNEDVSDVVVDVIEQVVKNDVETSIISETSSSNNNTNERNKEEFKTDRMETVRLDSFESDKKYTKTTTTSESVPVKKSMCNIS
jgi:uncharacterized membrane-anchored protein YjiN (DUF445 family)